SYIIISFLIRYLNRIIGSSQKHFNPLGSASLNAAAVKPDKTKRFLLLSSLLAQKIGNPLFERIPDQKSHAGDGT
ncbi:MAG: hypothetical protein LUE87_04580, partial [Lachnospiraceae bacterium]|nr:hypothetical protein [Lachnospiraceae bacterium]